MLFFARELKQIDVGGIMGTMKVAPNVMVVFFPGRSYGCLIVLELDSWGQYISDNRQC